MIAQDPWPPMPPPAPRPELVSHMQPHTGSYATYAGEQRVAVTGYRTSAAEVTRRMTAMRRRIQLILRFVGQQQS